MRNNYRIRHEELERKISVFQQAGTALPGLELPGASEALIGQVIDSERRVQYVKHLLTRQLDPQSVNPDNVAFDPLKAAVIHRNNGDFDEAIWMVFMFVHFGKHRHGGWRYARDIYGRLGDGGRWSWTDTAADITAFRFWLHDHQDELRRMTDGRQGFGNHRKRESLSAWEMNGTGEVFASYVAWVHATGETHADRFASVEGLSPTAGFDHLYEAMRPIRRFGRIARFDYLTMLMKLEMLNIAPGHSYLIDASGPVRGANLLLFGTEKRYHLTGRNLEQPLQKFAAAIDVTPDVLEDAVCNWQKKPTAYAPVRL